MNYAIVAIGGVILLVCTVWLLWGRHHFVGPVKTLSVGNDDAREIDVKAG